MEPEINSLNVEIGVFLRNIRAYTNRKDARISNKTVALLLDAVSCIDKLVSTVNVADDVMNEIGIEFLENLDDRYYELRQSIVCRMCIDSMAITKEDLEAHEKKVSHIFQARNMQAPTTQNLSDSRSSKLTNYSYQLDSSRSVTTCDESNQDKYSLKVLNNLTVDSTTEPNMKRNFETVLDTVDRAKREQLEEQMRQEQSHVKSEEQRRKEAGSLEAVVDVAWKGVRVLESSDSDSSDSSSHGFNFDSIYLIEIRNLPAAATRREISEFFNDINILNGIYGIHFVLDEKYRKYGRAFVQLENLKEYRSIHKFNMKRLDNRYIEVATGNIKEFKEMIAQRKIPSKDRVVFVSGLPQIFNEQNIRLFFHGLQINRIHMVQSSTATYSDCAYVQFSSMDDVEKAIKRSDKTISSVRIYRSTDQQMRNCYQGGSKRASLPSSSSSDDANSQMDGRSKSRGNSKRHSDESKFVRVTGLPWKADKEFVYNLFPGLEIDRLNGIALERNTGVTFVEIKNAADYEIALKADLRDTSRHLKVTKAMEAEFSLTKQANNS